MSFWASFIFLFIFLFLTSFRASAQEPTYTGRFCPNTTTFTNNSTYFTNLKILLSSLSSPNASYSTGFQNATAGQAPDRVTGLFLCRGDVSPEFCRRCVLVSINETFSRCSNARETVLYYDECMLRYSHRNIFSTLTLDGGVIKMNGDHVSANVELKERFQDLVSYTLNQVAKEASKSSRKFYTRKAIWNSLESLYSLVQCTPDLTRIECLRCLQESFNRMPISKIGGRLLWPSCNSRYELYSFYNETAIGIPPPPLLQPVSSPAQTGKSGKSSVLVVVIVVPIIVVILLSITGYCFHAMRAKKTYDTASAYDGDDITTADSLQLDYRTIQTATNGFSERNKIGQGGFGEVYKGTLSNGTEVAVKRLSKTSGQGDTEFKNEVVVVAKLQHRNLVRLQGFCLQGKERILVYEYVPNQSLDYIIFDPTKKGQLDWTLRFMIISGVARGILYLHQDSRLTVIHRDLKASNILLDADMNPKVADFGMARIFGMDQTGEKTSRVVGTFGYMSPEYAMCGQFSMKSDVYSFGVLVLEIVSGRRNSSFHETDGGARDLVTYAWRLWRNGTAMDLVDPIIADNCQTSEVVRCIHIGLLCVQEDPVERPTMSTILVMLTSNTMTLPVPRQPGSFQSMPRIDHLLDLDQSTKNKSVPASVDDVSITDLYPR